MEGYKTHSYIKENNYLKKSFGEVFLNEGSLFEKN